MSGNNMGKESMTLEDIQEQHRQYAEIIGVENLMKLSEVYGGDSIYVPKMKNLLKNKTYGMIYDEFDGGNIKQLEKKYDVSKATIYKIIRNKIRKKKPIEGQMSISDFGL